MGVKWLVYLFIVCNVRSLAEPENTRKPFPPCEHVAQLCGARCISVPISFSYTDGYSSSNVLCMDGNSVDKYILHGCPFAFYDSSITGEVCSIVTDSNGTDLLLTASQLGPGMHSFDCVLSPASELSVSSYVIVANDSNPYRSVLVYINGELQRGRGIDSEPNIMLDMGDNVTIAIEAVGNVSVIDAIGERFVCETGFACSGAILYDGSNRYLQCSLPSPANMSDDGMMLRVLIDNVQLTELTITVNEGPLLPPSLSTSQDAISPTSTTTVADVTPSQNTTSNIVELSSSAVVTTAITTTVITATGGTTVDHTTATGHNIVPTNTPIDTGPTGQSSNPVVAVAAGIAASIGALIALVGILGFVCWRHKKTKHPQVAMKDMEMTTFNAYKVLSYSCPHCDKLDQQIKGKGYMIQKLPNKELTNVYKEEISMNKSVPVIVCGHPDCKVSCSLLESSPIPENWNILQLYHNSDENPPQSNERLKVIDCTDLDEGIPTDKVLGWLDSVSRRGSITSTDGRLLELGKDVKTLVYRTEEILEKQDQANTSLSALQIDARQE